MRIPTQPCHQYWLYLQRIDIHLTRQPLASRSAPRRLPAKRCPTLYCATSSDALTPQHLHSLNIVYRDIKAENVLLTGGFFYTAGWPVLTDFGLATFYTAEDGLYSFCGTPNFLAPEIASQVGRSCSTGSSCAKATNCQKK